MIHIEVLEKKQVTTDSYQWNFSQLVKIPKYKIQEFNRMLEQIKPQAVCSVLIKISPTNLIFQMIPQFLSMDFNHVSFVLELTSIILVRLLTSEKLLQQVEQQEATHFTFASRKKNGLLIVSIRVNDMKNISKFLKSFRKYCPGWYLMLLCKDVHRKVFFPDCKNVQSSDSQIFFYL